MGKRGGGGGGSAEVGLQEDSGRVQGEWSDRDSALARVSANPSEAIRLIGSWKDQPFAEELALAIVNAAEYESDWCDTPTQGWYVPQLLSNFSSWSDAPWAEKIMLKAVRSVETRYVLDSMPSWVSAPFARKIFYALINNIAGFDDEDTLDAFDQDLAGGDPDERYATHVSGVYTQGIGNLLGCLYASEAKEQPWVLDLLEYLVTKIPESVGAVSGFIGKFTNPPPWMNDSLAKLLKKTKREEGIRDVHSRHRLSRPSFKEGSAYAVHGACLHLTARPDGDSSEPVELIRVGGKVTDFPDVVSFRRVGKERCAFSEAEGVNRMVGPGQVRYYCRKAFQACAIFQAGSG